MHSITQPFQDWLLQSAFLQGEDCLEAWKAWKSAVDLEAPLDPGSFRLLPLAYRNLLGHGLDDPLFPKITGISHQNWVRNQLILAELKDILSGCQEAGVEIIALGALALVLQGQPDLSLYPARSISMLVREGQARRVVELVGEKWVASPALPLSSLDRTLAARPSWLFYSPQGNRLRLYWRIPGSLWRASWLNSLWEERKPLDVDGDSMSVPGPGEQLILTSLEEPYPARPSSFMQAVEMLLVLGNCAGELPWNSVVQIVQEVGLSRRFQCLAQYLEELLQVSNRYPGFSQLLAIKSSSNEILSEKLNWRRRASLESFPYTWVNYWQRNSNKNRAKKLVGFIKLLVVGWRMEYLWQAPWFLISILLLRFN